MPTVPEVLAQYPSLFRNSPGSRWLRGLHLEETVLYGKDFRSKHTAKATRMFEYATIVKNQWTKQNMFSPRACTGVGISTGRKAFDSWNVRNLRMWERGNQWTSVCQTVSGRGSAARCTPLTSFLKGLLVTAVACSTFLKLKRYLKALKISQNFLRLCFMS